MPWKEEQAQLSLPIRVMQASYFGLLSLLFSSLIDALLHVGDKPILVKLLLSIDRREDTSAAMRTVELAKKYQGQGVVGIDLSGNPSVGSWDDWLTALQHARDEDLKITAHAAEVCLLSSPHQILGSLLVASQSACLCSKLSLTPGALCSRCGKYQLQRPLVEKFSSFLFCLKACYRVLHVQSATSECLG